MIDRRAKAAEGIWIALPEGVSADGQRRQGISLVTLHAGKLVGADGGHSGHDPRSHETRVEMRKLRDWPSD